MSETYLGTSCSLLGPFHVYPSAHLSPEHGFVEASELENMTPLHILGYLCQIRMFIQTCVNTYLHLTHRYTAICGLNVWMIGWSASNEYNTTPVCATYLEDLHFWHASYNKFYKMVSSMMLPSCCRGS
jgi:hypothetical protein